VATAAPTPTASPFDGTPAERFAVGTAGIVLPRADAVPDGHLADYELRTRAVTAEEVADALEEVRRSLIAARLGHSMLVEHDPESYIQTLSPGHWEVWSRPEDPLWTRAREWYEPSKFANRATLLAPDATLAAVPRVDGRIAYRAATTLAGTPAGETQPYRILEVVTRFVWVYAFEAPAGAIVVVRDEVVWYLPADYRLSCCEQNLGVHQAGAESRAWGADCGAYAEGLIRPGGPLVAGVPAAVFDLDQRWDPADGCRPAG
jgi:hypothetical protein